MNTTLLLGDCLDKLKELPDNSIDAIVTDPPYGLSFMGNAWDKSVPSKAVWEECLRVLKPGGYLLAFAGTRTQHRMAVAIEDAGFEIKDIIGWVYGCLDDQTKIATLNGTKSRHEVEVGEPVLCYDIEAKEYSYQPILEIVEYEYCDTAYRLVGDFGEQVVSRNHRCIVERGGKEIFVFAEEAAQEQEVRVPFLESLPRLRQAISDTQRESSVKKQDMQQELRGFANQQIQKEDQTTKPSKRERDSVCSVRNTGLETGRLASQSKNTDLQQEMQRQTSEHRSSQAFPQGKVAMDGRIKEEIKATNDWREKPLLERGRHIQESQGAVWETENKICSMSDRNDEHGSKRRVCGRASANSCIATQEAVDPIGVCSPHQSQCNRQPDIKLDAVCEQQRSQSVRTWSQHKTHLVRIEPFQYTGKMWCLRVPTGAFVAVRNGVAFPTGNSGFPKSHNISKALDKAAGAERKVVGTIKKLQSYGNGVNEVYGGEPDKGGVQEITAPATELSAKWEGWGTALKPAFEPITMARKPFKGTVAANVAEHGTGALNIDACRVGTEMAGARPGKKEEQAKRNLFLGLKNFEGNRAPGRWPANLIHDGSDEVMEVFPETKSQQRTGKRSGKEKGTLGSFAGQENVVMGHNDQGSAARFFYCAKASKADRDEGLEGFQEKARPTMGSGIGGQPNQQAANNRNHHPTVKPTSLMRYLCRLVTQPGGTILDPFMGSGSTGKAAKLEGFNFVGIEIDPDYLAIAEARINAAQPDPPPPQQPTLFD